MKIAICDDQQVFIDRLKNLISYEEAEIYVFNSGDKLLMSDINFDIIGYRNARNRRTERSCGIISKK